ncbi:MAG: hypothetical protein JXQ23_12995 [Clostridia bacterium]|nr:hypothetical protein [Clostridia bacterium]
MKSSFTSKIRVIIILLFLISLVQGLIILLRVANFNDLNSLRMDIQNTIYISVFFQFLLSIILIFYLPVFLHNAFSEIHNILKDISQGIYTIELDTGSLEKSLDKEFFAVVLEIQRMLKSVVTFDNLKKEKIVEHHSRILSILNMTENGFIVLDMNGNIVYINDKVTENFSAISEKTNLLDKNFPPEIENNIKKYAVSILKNKSKQEYQQFFIPSLKRHIGINSGIVRGADGEMKGVVLSLSNLDRKKSERPKDKEAENTT